MDFPLLKTFQIDTYIVDFLNKKCNQYQKTHKSWNNDTAFSNSSYNSGYQSDNLLNWDDVEYQEFIHNNFLELISKLLMMDKNKITYYWNHFLEYKNGGKMGEHKHNHSEDYVFFVYLNTCNTGHTSFYLNDFCSEYKSRTKINIKPTKNLAVLFSSMLLHEGEFTIENKKIFVAGIRINLE